jgi:DNA-binding response OmpR family regulator
LVINQTAHKVTKRGSIIDLSSTEYTLLLYLIQNANRVLTRKEILINVWNSDIYTENTVNTYIMRLREKIEDNKNEPDYLITIRGEGYLFEV